MFDVSFATAQLLEPRPKRAS